MASSRTALAPAHRRALYGALALTWLSGALWLVDRYFRQVQSDFGLQAPPTQAVWLEVHGAAAMAILVLVGTLLPEHVRFGWSRGDRRPSGALALAILASLALTGWALYYVGDQGLRQRVSVLHWAVGLALPAAVAAHVAFAKRRR